MPGTIRTTLVLPLPLWRAVRYQAADEQTTLNQLVLRALEQALNARKGAATADQGSV